jgi:hypothetical protein
MDMDEDEGRALCIEQSLSVALGQTPQSKASFVYVIEKSLENIMGYMSIKHPEKALQALFDLHKYLHSEQRLDLLQGTYMQRMIQKIQSEVITSSSFVSDSSGRDVVMSLLEHLDKLSLGTGQNADACVETMSEPDVPSEYMAEDDVLYDADDEKECSWCGDCIPGRRMQYHIQEWCRVLHPQS